MPPIDRKALEREQAAIADDVTSSGGPLAPLMDIAGVEGVGVTGEHRAVVYVRDASVGARLPKEYAGYHLSCQVTGLINAL